MTDETTTTACAPAWAHTHGHLAIKGPQPVPTTLQELADRDLVRESALRYSYGYDERRTDLLRELLTEDAKFSISVSGPEVQTVAGRETVITWLADIMAAQPDQRRHVVSNVLIEELSEHRATVVTYLAIFSVEEAASLATTGFYRFDLEKHDGRWLVSHIFDGLDRGF